MNTLNESSLYEAALQLLNNTNCLGVAAIHLHTNCPIFYVFTGLNDNPGHTRTTPKTIDRQCDPFQRKVQVPCRIKFKIKDMFDFNPVINAYVS